MKFKMETVRRIFNDMDKSISEISPDGDGLGLVEIRYREEDGNIQARLSFPPTEARLVAEAMLLCANEIEKKF